jgi:hypothetical protein
MPTSLREQATTALAAVQPTSSHSGTQKIRAIKELRRTPGFGHHNLRELADAVDWAMDQAETVRLFADLKAPTASEA